MQTIKEFLRSDWKKITLTILLFVFMPFPYYESNPVCLAIAGIKCEPYWDIGFIGIGTIIDLYEAPSFFSLSQYLRGLWIFYLASIITWYLLACTIFSGFNKIKKR